MAALTDLRADLATAIESVAQVSAFGFLPERIVPPVAVISPASPYLSIDIDGGVYGEHLVNFRVDIVSSTQANSMRTEAIDELIEMVYAGLIAEGWLVGQVTQPYGMQANNATYLAVTIEVAAHNKF
jgi:hypothetical protein